MEHDVSEPETLTVREPTLDDVFLKLTGHRTDVAADDADRAPAQEGAA